ncbi:hypothetical protein GWC95_03675 [Sediminibacterium roseum]|uniref:Glyoxalase-like domain-containing protein n=1 Tax=Sediminibacterium roseum TaxID=1978412 RepID=A0ABW9ZPH5_9BACT|nr:hypothetical protein [Sediminibacterium roseum]NCI49006.1 hypothetical protein [Sediminibacterium roseum]
MHFTQLVPNIFYEDINVGLDLFVNCLEFKIGYNGLAEKRPCCVVGRDGLAVFLFQDKFYADKDRPEIRIHTTDIEEAYKKISASHPHLLHPNLSRPTLRPWGAREFALADPSHVCVIIQQW